MERELEVAGERSQEFDTSARGRGSVERAIGIDPQRRKVMEAACKPLGTGAAPRDAVRFRAGFRRSICNRRNKNKLAAGAARPGSRGAPSASCFLFLFFYFLFTFISAYLS